MTKPNIAIFASGTGSNFQAIAAHRNDLAAEIVLLVCDNPEAPVIAKAEKLGIPAFVFQPKSYANKEEYESEILRELKKKNVSWIFLAGYMRIVGPTLLNPYRGKIVNIHPSLLPSFPGKDAVGQALEAGVKWTGVTVHYIDEGVDTGPIIAQEPVPVLEEDTKEILQHRIQESEHQLYPRVINQLLLQSEG
ncbi:phosphoribosylglycinamide formyltransferase [Compostibacillus humi]|jgi:phosphoribosylglycinamide formyltransferase-1|uniref:Phosphoribosylglycinamide formyltransferase n=1 Tax=Compostibacillus humi TaxID=1245525 RepID=A0A8J2ZSF6_9BACI|nr:phosphoribosylglycinamide formyltransferase [Compostibacillus humi]GGH73648.1 phosphoribosylglycinamide formyltransferase [Compostibacillus humi]HLT56813.1 phosphoribosylglycinamide formyltransferase [Bacillota bacterium]